MDITTESKTMIFELKPTGHTGKALALSGRRLLVGRSETCDLVLPFTDISAIHAVIEINGSAFKIYDMNSRNGTFVDGEKVVVKECRVNSKVQFGLHEFVLTEYIEEDVAPPLDLLRPPVLPGDRVGVVPEKKDPPVPQPQVSLPKESPESFKAPVSSPADKDKLPRVAYPLAADPKAEFSEYIFEDVDTLFPIFKYDVAESSVEIIILFKDRIHSVDYLPTEDGVYHLVGSNPQNSDVEYPYLSKTEKLPFVEIRNKDAYIHPLPGYDMLKLGDEMPKTPGGSVLLGQDDVVRFHNNDLEVYVRNTQSPPKVAGAPFFRRDREFKKYLLLTFLLVFLFLGSMSLFEVDKELEKEKAPERIATILYKKKLVVSKNKAIDKTKKAPKVAQKSPKVDRVKKKPNETKKPKPQKNPTKTPKKAVGKRKPVPAKKVKTAQKKVTKKRDIRRSKPSKRAGGATPTKTSNRKSPIKKKTQGHVDTYKSFDFSSTVSSLISKGGGASKAKVSAQVSEVGNTDITPGGSTSDLRAAKVSQNVGDLVGAAEGKLDTTKGVEGIVSKRDIYTAGLPYKTVILGSMDPDVIRRILLDNLAQFRYCYQKELDRSASSFSGIVRLNFVIGASGSVTRAGVQSSDSQLPASVKGCVVNVLKGIRFPEPQGGGQVEIKQPFNFYPRG